MATNKIAVFLCSEYLNTHMTLFVLMIFTYKVMGFSIWRQFAKNPITALPLQRSGILKRLYLQHNYSIFVITPFKKEMMNIFFPEKNKTRQNKTGPTQLAFSSDAF